MSELERLRAINAELYEALIAMLREPPETTSREYYALRENARAAVAKAREPLAAWSQYRPADLTDDELAEYVIQSKGAVIL